MRVNGVHWRSISRAPGAHAVQVIDQLRMPHAFGTATLRTLEEAAAAITAMVVRGAPLIGVTAAYGVALAMAEDPSDAALARACAVLARTRPTAVNLRWALEAMTAALQPLSPGERLQAAWARADALAEQDVATCRALGVQALPLLERAAARTGGRVNVLTHCNAGWLATVDHGTALSPLFLAHDRGMDLHVWVDETRPRSQGYLTAWELQQHGVPCTLVADNVGGHLMQHGKVDLCIVGADRVSRRGDVCNKIGTYLKALAAHDNGVPFYAAVPSSTVDWGLEDGVRDIPIEERSEREVHEVKGRTGAGELVTVTVTPPGVRAANPGFDVTPARLVTGLVTERGVCEATSTGLAGLFPGRT
jgi:methylthioribose-1-phosphate isomerase